MTAPTFKTEQEEFWAGEFGNEYIDRNHNDDLINSNVNLFRKIFSHTENVKSITEFGCNIGLNLAAIERLLPEVTLQGFEINQRAIKIAPRITGAKVIEKSVLEDLGSLAKADITFTKTVLIHINPEHLAIVYDNLYKLSNRYILTAEYYNPAPVEVEYRGNKRRLFKRDFAGDLIHRFGMKLINYGFVYKNDRFPQDDITWFLLEK